MVRGISLILLSDHVMSRLRSVASRLEAAREAYTSSANLICKTVCCEIRQPPCSLEETTG